MDQQCSRAQACVSHWNHMAVIWEPIALSVHMVLTVDHIWPLKACGRSLQQTSSHTHRHCISHTPTLLCLGISLLTSGQTMTRITYQCPCTVLLLYENSAQPNWTGVRDYLGGCILIEICQSTSFCYLLFEKFKGLLLLWSKFEGCLFPCQPSQWFG